MKKMYIPPVVEIMQLDEEEHICTTSTIDMGGQTDHFDSRGSMDEFDEDEDEEELIYLHDAWN
jgi:hypothetical protein